jgi:hypothetical protein
MEGHSSNLPKKHRFKMVQKVLAIGGFAILAGLCGFGATWLVVGVIAKIRFNTLDEQLIFAGKSMPILIAGGVVGSIIGLVISFKVVQASPRTQIELERKYLRPGDYLRIYFGFPVFVIALATPLFKRLPRLFGESYFVYIILGIALAIIAASMVLYDRIPRRFIIPIGITGWLLTLSLVCWFFFFGPGAW